VLDKTQYSAFESTLNSCIVSYRIVSEFQFINRVYKVSRQFLRNFTVIIKCKVSLNS